MAFGKPVVWEKLAQVPGNPWLWGRRADFLWVAGGGYFLMAVVAAPLTLFEPSKALITALFLHLALLSNYPHYAATYQVLLRERATRAKDIRQLVLSVPVMLALLGAIARWPDLLLGPVVRLYLTWSAHHYAAQHFGIASMYCAKEGRPLKGRDKTVTQAAFLGVGAFMMLMANTVGGDPSATARVVGLADDGGMVPIADFPSWVYWPGLVMVAGCVVAMFVVNRRVGGGAGGAASPKGEQARTGFPRTVWLLFATNYAWFVLPNLRAGGGWMWSGLAVFLVGAPAFFHGVQYLAVTGHRSRTTGAIRPVWLYAGLVLVGYTLFNLTVDPVRMLTGVDPLRAILAIVAVVNLHHFWMDGLIWRRSRVTAPKPAAASAVLPSVSS